MTQVNQDVILYAGDDKELIVTIYDEDDNIIDLTGLVSAQWILKKKATDENEILNKSLANDIAITSATEGILTITFNAADTQEIQPRTYYHELRIENSNNKIGTVFVGSFIINPTEEIE